MFHRAVVIVQLYSRTGPAVPVGRPMYRLWCESAAVLSIWTRYPRAVEVVQLYSRTGPAVDDMRRGGEGAARAQGRCVVTPAGGCEVHFRRQDLRSETDESRIHSQISRIVWEQSGQSLIECTVSIVQRLTTRNKHQFHDSQSSSHHT